MPFKGPVFDQMMSRDEVRRRLRFVMSGRVRHRPLTMQAIAARCGLSRVAVYDAADGIMGETVQAVLSEVLREVDVNSMIADSAGLRRC